MNNKAFREHIERLIALLIVKEMQGQMETTIRLNGCAYYCTNVTLAIKKLQAVKLHDFSRDSAFRSREAVESHKYNNFF